MSIILMLSVHPVASQEGEELPPHEAAPPREAAVLVVTVSPQPDLSADLGEMATVPATVTNTGNIAALGVVVSVTDAGLLEGTPVNVGDLAPGAQVALELPVVVVGRSAFPLPFAVRATAANTESPTVVTAEQTFAAPNSDAYLPGMSRARVLLDRRHARYDVDRATGRALLWVELSNPNLHDRPAHVNLHRLLHGRVPADLSLRVLYYPDELSAPQELPTTYDATTTRLDLVLPGPGRYLVEWMKVQAADAAVPLAATAEEPEPPEGWTPSYHAPLVSEFTGSVTLQFPILTPPGAAGLQPNLGLSYSSANGNGMMGRLQADETGFGWTNTALIDVTQALDACQDDVCVAQGDIDGNPNTNDPYDPYTLSFGGVGYELVHIDGKAANGQPGQYYAQGNAGLYIELCKAPLSAYCAFLPADNNNMEYTQSNVVWRITGPDGTTYRLGARKESEQEILRPEDFSRDEEDGPRNLALRWRVDTVVDRFGNKMTYKYDEDVYNGWVHPEYFHTPASYLSTITYDDYRIEFDHVQLPYGAYREQGYGYSVSHQTRRLGQVRVEIVSSNQQIRHYSLTHDYQRHGQDNDTDHLPLEPVLDPQYGTQSPWCAAFNYVLDFKDGDNPDDNVTFVPNKIPVLLSIHEGGSNGAAKSGTPDTTFRYVFLGTGQYDHAAASNAHLRYCFPYLDTVETLYGPAGATPTTDYTWRDETSANPPTTNYGGLLDASYLGRYVNVVEKETANSGFAADAPAMEKYYTYSMPNLQGDDDTFQGFVTVNRCEGAACAEAWVRKTTLRFLTRPYYAADAALTGRTEYQEVRAHPNTLVARTEYTWDMLDTDGDAVDDADPTRVAVLTQQIERDYRGSEVATRTKYVYDMYGNQAETQEYGGTLTGNTPRRTLERLYNVNLDTGGDNWVVNLVERETLWDGPAGGADAKIMRRTIFRYDSKNCLDTSIDPILGQLTAEDHYLSGSAANCNAGSWLTTGYTYSATRKWQVTRITDPAGRFKTYAWTNATQLGSVTYAVDGTDYATSYTYDTVFRWQVGQVTQPNGAKTQYTYDVHGRLREAKPPNPGNGQVGPTAVEYNYGDTSNPFYVEEKRWAVDSVNPPTTRTFYDALGRPLQERRWNISSDFALAFTDTHYDNLGRVRCVTPPMSDAGPAATFNAVLVCPNQAHTLYKYDALDEQIEVKGLDGATTTTAVVGRERRVTNANNETTTYVSDDLGRLSQVQQPLGFTMTYGYNLADDLVSATASGGVTTTMIYDKLGRKTSMNDPDMGVWRYGYDGSGNLVRQTDAKDQRLCFYYDPGGRLTAKTHNGNGVTACPATAGGTSRATYSYYASGPGKGLVSAIDGQSGKPDDQPLAYNDDFVYDYRGRITSRTRSIDGQTYTLATTYDAADRPKTLTYPSGEVVSYEYDGDYPDGLHTAQGTTSDVLVDNLTYTQRGEVVWLARGPNGAAVPDTQYDYYGQAEAFRLERILHGQDNDSLPDFGYKAYDPVGRVKEILTDLGATTETQTFSYDAVGRLKTAIGTGAVAYDHIYTYVSGGNIATRIDQQATPDVTYTYAYGTAEDHHAHAVMNVKKGTTKVFEFAYDLNGNMTTRTVNGVPYTQTFDAENRLTKVTGNGQTTRFYYDTNGNRLLTIQPGAKVYTPFPEYEQNIPTSGATTTRSSYTLAGQLIAVRVKVSGSGGSNELYYAYSDHLGNVSAWLGKDSTGNWKMVSDSLARYEPFGNYRTKPAAAVNPDISDRGFTGHRQNNTGANDLGLIYMNARYYMPEIGRFISADTIVPEPINPQSYNRYSYSYNDPVDYTDPSGHCVGNPDGVGNTYDENLCWAKVNTIQNLWNQTDYWQERWGTYDNFFTYLASNPLLSTDFFSDELLRYEKSSEYDIWRQQQSPYPTPPPLETGEYWVLSLTSAFPMPFFVGGKIIRDDWGTWYVNVHEGAMPGISLMRGQIYINDNTKPTDAVPLADFPDELQPDLAESALPGVAGGLSGGYYLGGGISVSAGPKAHVFAEGGLYSPGISSEIGLTFVLPWTR